jgi:hypothetical protein
MNPEVRRYVVDICTPCMNLEGEMCSTPGCIFCWHTMDEVRSYLSVMLILPVIDGVSWPPIQQGTFVSGRRRRASS